MALCAPLPAGCQVQGALRWAIEQLAGTDEPALSARLLLAHVLACTTTDLFTHPERRLDPAACHAYQDLVARRARHEPVAYLTGHQTFRGLDLLVGPQVLIPRPETELLVELALAAASRWPAPRVADVGTGSGAIAVSLAMCLPHAAQVWAIDRSEGALSVARTNAQRCGVAARISFLHGDLLAPLPGSVDLAVANLPYVSEAEYDALPPGIRCYEPREALAAGEDGLDAIRALLATAPTHLSKDAVLLLEIGAIQGARVAALAARAFPEAQVDICQDYARHNRIVRIERPGISPSRSL
jgi:release factor glutamine methyltransferase